MPKNGPPIDKEIHDLAEAAGYEILYELKYRGSKIDRMNFLPQSWLEDLEYEIQDLDHEVMIVNQSLSPLQVSSLETHYETRVIDKIMLVLEIFAQKASTNEVKLQIELANLLYTYPRAQSSLQRNLMSERQARMMGRGEQLKDIVEANVRHRVAQLKKKLAEHERRTQSRNASEALKIPIVGFYSAGKSTLFNSLTGSDIQEVDSMAFTTMFAKTSRTNIFGYPVDLLDTVGLVDLPKNVLNAFNQMLKPILNAPVVVIVLDSTLKIAELANQLKYIKRVFVDNAPDAERKYIVVFSKTDLVDWSLLKGKSVLVEEEEWLVGAPILFTQKDDPEKIRREFVEVVERLIESDLVYFEFDDVSPKHLSKFYEWARVGDVVWNNHGTCNIKGVTTHNWFVKLNSLE